jgi:hypothetical protein
MLFFYCPIAQTNSLCQAAPPRLQRARQRCLRPHLALVSLGVSDASGLCVAPSSSGRLNRSRRSCAFEDDHHAFGLDEISEAVGAVGARVRSISLGTLHSAFCIGHGFQAFPPSRRSRSRQRDGQRITTQHHKADQPPDCPFAISVGADEFGDIANGSSLGLGLTPPGAWAPQRRDHERSAAFKQGQRFRAGIEGRISVLMRGRGMKRCRAEGAERFALFVAAAVLANNLMIIGELLTCSRRRPKTNR